MGMDTVRAQMEGEAAFPISVKVTQNRVLQQIPLDLLNYQKARYQRYVEYMNPHKNISEY